MTRLLVFTAICISTLSGCDPSYSDVRDVPAFPGSAASALQFGPDIHTPGYSETSNPADTWQATLQVDSLIAPTFGVPVLGYQRHSIRDTVTVAAIASFLDAGLGPRGFRRNRAPDAWAIPFQPAYMGGDGMKAQVAAWVRDAPAEGDETDRTVVVVAYATPWPPGQDRARTTFYVVFLGRGIVGRAGSTVPAARPATGPVQ